MVKITGIVHIGDKPHPKTVESLKRMCTKMKVPLSFDDQDEDNLLYNVVLYVNNMTIPRYRNKLYIYGPNIWIGKETIGTDPSYQDKYRNTYYNILSKNNHDFLSSFGLYMNPELVSLPYSIDVDKWVPLPKKKKILIYVKIFFTTSQQQVDSFNLVAQNFVDTFPDHEVKIYDYNTKYDEEDFLKDCQDARAALYVGFGESQGFAFQQMLSCDVAIVSFDHPFAQHESSFHPYAKYGLISNRSYWDKTCGEFFFKYETSARILAIFKYRLDKNYYQPRKFILSTLTDELCWKRYEELFQRWEHEHLQFVEEYTFTEKDEEIVDSLINNVRKNVPFVLVSGGMEEKHQNLQRLVSRKQNYSPETSAKINDFYSAIQMSDMQKVEVAITDTLLTVTDRADIDNNIFLLKDTKLLRKLINLYPNSTFIEVD